MKSQRKYFKIKKIWIAWNGYILFNFKKGKKRNW